MLGENRKSNRRETVRRQGYGWAEKTANLLARVSLALGLKPTELDPDLLLKVACQRTGLSDFGDSRFMEGYRRVLAEGHDRFTPLGTFLLRNMILKALENRLRVQCFIQRCPAVLKVPVKRPLVVLGFPRSGTTLLQSLLTLPLGRSPLEFWELYWVAPVKEGNPRRDREYRIKQSEQLLRVTEFIVPELRRMHESTATSPEEDWQLFIPTFQALSFQVNYGLGDYGQWLRSEADMSWAYTEFKRMLQLILYQRPRQQLVLKCPDHLWFLDSLLEVFPDACIVQTHRDPLRSTASYASMISLHKRTFNGNIDWPQLGKVIFEHFHDGAARAHAARQHHEAQQFFDVDFREFTADPTAMVDKISKHFGITPPDRGSVSAYLETQRADKPGKHRYSHDRLALDVGEIRDRFRWYTEAYGVSVEEAEPTV